MAARVYVYLGFTCLVVLYAAIRGGLTERRGAAIWTVANVLSLAAVQSHLPTIANTSPALVAIDVATALSFAWLGRTEDQFWLRWATALQVFTVATHVAQFIEPEIQRWAYKIFIYGPGWGVVTLLAVGTRGRVLARETVASASSPT